jgi:Mrp family chromosome partitioning ATPase
MQVGLLDADVHGPSLPIMVRAKCYIFLLRNAACTLRLQVQPRETKLLKNKAGDMQVLSAGCAAAKKCDSLAG